MICTTKFEYGELTSANADKARDLETKLRALDEMQVGIEVKRDRALTEYARKTNALTVERNRINAELRKRRTVTMTEV